MHDTNYGAHTSYILVTAGLLPWIKRGDIQASIRWSGHFPAYIDLHEFSLVLCHLSDGLTGCQRVGERACYHLWTRGKFLTPGSVGHLEIGKLKQRAGEIVRGGQSKTAPANGFKVHCIYAPRCFPTIPLVPQELEASVQLRGAERRSLPGTNSWSCSVRSRHGLSTRERVFSFFQHPPSRAGWPAEVWLSSDPRYYP